MKIQGKKKSLGSAKKNNSGIFNSMRMAVKKKKKSNSLRNEEEEEDEEESSEEDSDADAGNENIARWSVWPQDLADKNLYIDGDDSSGDNDSSHESVTEDSPIEAAAAMPKELVSPHPRKDKMVPKDKLTAIPEGGQHEKREKRKGAKKNPTKMMTEDTQKEDATEEGEAPTNSLGANGQSTRKSKNGSVVSPKGAAKKKVSISGDATPKEDKKRVSKNPDYNITSPGLSPTKKKKSISKKPKRGSVLLSLSEGSEPGYDSDIAAEAKAKRKSKKQGSSEGGLGEAHEYDSDGVLGTSKDKVKRRSNRVSNTGSKGTQRHSDSSRKKKIVGSKANSMAVILGSSNAPLSPGNKGYDSDGLLGDAKAKAKRKSSRVSDNKRASKSQSPNVKGRPSVLEKMDLDRVAGNKCASKSQSPKVQDRPSVLDKMDLDLGQEKPTEEDNGSSVVKQETTENKEADFQKMEPRGFSNVWGTLSVPFWDQQGEEVSKNARILSATGEKSENETADILGVLEQEQEEDKQNTSESEALKKMRAEIQALSMQNESLEMQLQEELSSKEEMQNSQRVSSSGAEVDVLEAEFEMERREWKHKVENKEMVIQRLQETIDSAIINNSNNEEGNMSATLLKHTQSVEQTKAQEGKLKNQEEKLLNQQKRIDELTEKLASTENQWQVKIKESRRNLKEENEALNFELDELKKEHVEMMQRKDETIEFFQTELAKLKLGKSQNSMENSERLPDQDRLSWGGLWN